MKDFLLDMFRINQEANIKMAASVKDLPEQNESLKLLSHLANCQYKWLDRINVFPGVSALDWWLPVYSTEDLPKHFIDSSQQWISYLSGMSEEDLDSEIKYVGYDGSTWEAKLKDIALQLIFHSFHHRAQIQMMIRGQGYKPDFIDYIGYKAKKAGAS